MNFTVVIAIILAKCWIILAASTNRLRVRDERIIGGHEAKPNSHPYIVSLQLRFFWVRAHICGGSILTENWILTAGHCITESWIIRWLPMDAIAGAHNVDKFGPKAQIVGIDQRIPHPLYKGGIGAHDIAVLKTKVPIKFTKAVQPVNLPQPNFRYENLDSLKLSGWGALRTTLIFPDMPTFLQEVDLTYVPFEKCYEAFDKLAEDEEIPLNKDSNMCTGPITGGVAACSGDSGGPLVYYFNTKYATAPGRALSHDYSQPKVRHIRQSDDTTTTEDPDETSPTEDDSTTTEDPEETSAMEEETMSTSEESESESTTEDASTTEDETMAAEESEETTTEEETTTTEETSTMDECRSAKCMSAEDTDEATTEDQTTTTDEPEETTTEEETTTTEEPGEMSTMEECRSAKCLSSEDTDETTTEDQTTTTDESEETTTEEETTTTEEPGEMSTMEECRSAKCLSSEDTDETTTEEAEETTTEEETNTTEESEETTTEEETTTTEEPDETSTLEECRSGKCMMPEEVEETTTQNQEETTTEEETIATEEELSETESTTTEDPEETTTEEDTTTTEAPEETTSTTEFPTTDADSSEEYYSYEYQDLLDYIYDIFFGSDEESDEDSEDDDDDDDETLRRQPKLVQSVERNEAIPMILGVVSWGVSPCGEKGAPTVYTKVSSHIDFINKHIY